MNRPVELVTTGSDGAGEEVDAGATGDAPPAPSQHVRAVSSAPNEPRAPAPGITPALLRLGAWNYYFLAKLVLFWKGSLNFHPLENLAFAAFLLAPIRSATWRRARNWVAIPCAAALLYYDSWLPRIGRALSQVALLSDFTVPYLMELLGRFISWPAVATLVITWAAYRVVALGVRVGVLVVVTLVVLTVTDHPAGLEAGLETQASAPAVDGIAVTNAAQADPDSMLQAFYAKEAQRSVAFAKPASSDAPFDLIFLHVCSLSWDDLRMMQLENEPLWKRFDIVLTRFNSAASYSGPAAIRMLRAPCGQPAHGGLYSPARRECYLMSALEEAGFEPNLVLNHDGRFDDFIGVVRERGGLRSAPMPLDGVPVVQRSFDDSPIYDDLAVLSRWLERRQDNGAARVAAFYNTVSLHDGNHLVGADAKLNSRDTYTRRLAKLLADLDQFVAKLEASGRRVVVALVPEHGGAMRGDSMQVAGLREIPSPAIALVPVGVKVIGPQAGAARDTVYAEVPTSYLALAHIVSGMLQKSPFAGAGFVAANYLSALPATDFVAENEDMVIMQRGEQFLLRLGKDGWSEYPAGPR
jgi:cellulose synthase operon protein YhjU